MADRFDVSVILMRRLLPARLYPGRARVGKTFTQLSYVPDVVRIGSVDWYWLPSLSVTALKLVRGRPDFLVFQWWTGTVLHTYLALAILGRLLGAAIVIEFHEVLDTGEDRIPFARRYVSLLAPLFVRLAAGFVIHSESDRTPLATRYRLGGRPCIVVPHGPYEHHRTASADGGAPARRRPPDPAAFNLLFFGVIRPFKGLEDLIEAFDGLDEEEVGRYWLTVVGETWEGWELPAERIARSAHRARITFVNRYVDDAAVAAFFAGADAVVLPYHRSSASGPAHVAMSHGLPLVITSVGGLPAAVADYDGAVVVPPHDPPSIRAAIRRLADEPRRGYRDPHSWERTSDRYADLFEILRATGSRRKR